MSAEMRVRPAHLWGKARGDEEYDPMTDPMWGKRWFVARTPELLEEHLELLRHAYAGESDLEQRLQAARERAQIEVE